MAKRSVRKAVTELLIEIEKAAASLRLLLEEGELKSAFEATGETEEEFRRRVYGIQCDLCNKQIWSNTKNVDQAEAALRCFEAEHHIVPSENVSALRDVVVPNHEPWFGVRCTPKGICLIGPYEAEWQATAAPENGGVNYFTHQSGLPKGSGKYPPQAKVAQPEKTYLTGVKEGKGWKLLRRVNIPQ